MSIQTVQEMVVANDNVVVQFLCAPNIEIQFITAPVWVATETVAGNRDFVRQLCRSYK